MQRPTIVTLLLASVFTAVLPPLSQAAVAPEAAKPLLSIDPSQLPAPPPIIPEAQREQMVLMATGAGAAVAVIAVDLLSGGLLLAPLGVPSATSLVGFGGGGVAAAAAPVYSVAQRFFAGVGTIAAAIAGGYIGGHFARAHPELVGIPQ